MGHHMGYHMGGIKWGITWASHGASNGASYVAPHGASHGASYVTLRGGHGMMHLGPQLSQGHHENHMGITWGIARNHTGHHMHPCIVDKVHISAY